MLKTRLAAAGLPTHLTPHSFRVMVVTALLSQNVPVEEVQHLVGHSHPSTTQLYDRRRRRINRSIVERIPSDLTPRQSGLRGPADRGLPPNAPLRLRRLGRAKRPTLTLPVGLTGQHRPSATTVSPRIRANSPNRAKTGP